MDFVSEPRNEPRVTQRIRPSAADTSDHREPSLPPARTRLSPGSAAALQRQAGNRAVSRLVVQRLADGKAGTRRGPGADPKFAAVKRDVRAKKQTLAKHPPPKAEAGAAQGAAKAPPDDKEAQGKTANAEKMNAAKPGEFDKAAFVKAVNEAIAKQAPKNLDEADKFGDSGKADAVKGEVQGKVSSGKETSAKAIETATSAPPDTSAAKDKPVTPLKPDRPPPKPGAPNPAQAVPDKAPPAAADFSDGPQQVDQQMADAEVTEEQLAKSNEPEFTGALKEKKEGERHAATAPGQVRAAEAKTLAGAKAQAAQAGAAAMATMAGDRAKAGKEVGAGKEGAKSEDEKKREQVTATLQKVFDATKKDVEDILNGLDKKVDDKFDTGEKAARDAFTTEYTGKIDAYKERRYSGLIGKGRWVKDQFAGLPDEVNVYYEQARKGYVNRMQGVISGVADLIGAELTRAKQRIAKGRADLQAEVKKLPADLQAIGKEAAGEFADKFDELTEQVNSKGDELVDTLASKYTEALKAVDEEIAAEKEKNKGLIAKAIDAMKGVIDTILQLKNLLLGVLAKAAQAVGAIIKDPIGFLGKLISGVGAGLRAFMTNIANHLQKGLVSWLLGAAAKAGLQLPQKFDLKGILQLIGSLLGLTWGAIRGRVIAKGVPAQAMGAVESSVPMAQKIQAEGIGGVWEQIKEKVGDLKDTLLSKIREYLIPTVIVAGITWIISLLNPASAFIKACKAIIDIVRFIIERGAQIVAFVNAVLDAVIAIARGAAGGVAARIETALATGLPVLIGFLAALLGIGGIADKVKKLFQSLSKPVMKAVDWIVGKIAALARKLWSKLKGKGKQKEDGKAKKGKDPQIREYVTADVNAALGDGVQDSKVRPAIRAIFNNRRRQGLEMLEVRKGGTPGQFDIYMAASPVTKVRATKVDPGDADARRLLDQKGNPYAEFGLNVPRDVVLAGSFKLPVAGRPGGYGATHAIGELHTRTKVSSFDKVSNKNDQVHAEDKVIDEVKSNWTSCTGSRDEETVPGENRPKAVLDLKVTRSPCSRCASRLGGLRSWASGKSWNLQIEVRSVGLYHGKSEATDDEGATRTVRGITSGKEGLLRLKEWGITIKPMSATDPVILKELGKLDIKDQIALVERIDMWNSKLSAAIQEVAEVTVKLKKP